MCSYHINWTIFELCDFPSGYFWSDGTLADPFSWTFVVGMATISKFRIVCGRFFSTLWTTIRACVENLLRMNKNYKHLYTVRNSALNIFLIILWKKIVIGYSSMHLVAIILIIPHLLKMWMTTQQFRSSGRKARAVDQVSRRIEGVFHNTFNKLFVTLL